jgi:hypothetical protein
MPETYGLPEPEDPPFFSPESIGRTFSEVVAGQGVVRRVVLYVLVALGITLTATPVIWLGGALAFTCLILLMATDGGLA